MDELIELRRRRMLSQRELARLAGVTQPTIHYAETGKRVPHPGTLRRLAEALGVDPAVLTVGAEAAEELARITHVPALKIGA